MTDIKYEAQQNITIWWVLPNGFADPDSPRTTEVNAGLNITDVVTWENFGFGQQAANLIDFRSVNQNAAARTRGLENYGGTLGFFFPADYTNGSDQATQVYNALSKPGTYGYIVIRVDGKKTSEIAANGDYVSVFRVASDGWNWSGAGENPVTYQITFQPQGNVAVYSVLNDGTPTLVATPSTVSVAVGAKSLIKVTLEGREYTRGLKYTSSDSTKAVCSKNGVIRGLAVGSATITATDPNSNVSTTIAVTVTA